MKLEIQHRGEKGDIWMQSDDELRREKDYLFWDFVSDMIKYPVLCFVLPYIVGWSVVKVLLDNAPQLCQMIK